jgi:hypothetical protein
MERDHWYLNAVIGQDKLGSDSSPLQVVFAPFDIKGRVNVFKPTAAVSGLQEF